MRRQTNISYVIGGGMTGLAAGMSSGATVLEASEVPGGICSSYYMRDQSDPIAAPRDDAFRFEVGGGHWIFGGDPAVLRLIEALTPCTRSARKSSVVFDWSAQPIPYPIQNNLHALSAPTRVKALGEMLARGGHSSSRTMGAWLDEVFGETLSRLFFRPWHDLYTAGLTDEIAPQDPHKSPISIKQVIAGAFEVQPAVGYNTTYLYPERGLDALSHALAARCTVRYGKKVDLFHTDSREIEFSDGTTLPYDRVICTLPLDLTVRLAGLEDEVMVRSGRADPATSVLVYNIGAQRGLNCPDDHWVYTPDSRAGFHRVGFYSNVSPTFLPVSARKDGSLVSIYVERAFHAARPNFAGVREYGQRVVEELQSLGWIGSVEVMHPTWIECAYTWQRPGSRWKEAAISVLEDVGIFQVGRYARWQFFGIAESIQAGLTAGAASLINF